MFKFFSRTKKAADTATVFDPRNQKIERMVETATGLTVSSSWIVGGHWFVETCEIGTHQVEELLRAGRVIQ